MKREADSDIGDAPKPKRAHARAPCTELARCDPAIREEDAPVCPICQDIMSTMVAKNQYCDHRVCWACNMGFETCPMCRAAWHSHNVADPMMFRIKCAACACAWPVHAFKDHVCLANACPRECGWCGVRDGTATHPCPLQQCVLCHGAEHAVRECPRIADAPLDQWNSTHRTLVLVLACAIDRGENLQSADVFADLCPESEWHPYALEHVHAAYEKGLIGRPVVQCIAERVNAGDHKVRECYGQILMQIPLCETSLGCIRDALKDFCNANAMMFCLRYAVAGSPQMHVGTACARCAIDLIKKASLLIELVRYDPNTSHISLDLCQTVNEFVDNMVERAIAQQETHSMVMIGEMCMGEYVLKVLGEENGCKVVRRLLQGIVQGVLHDPERVVSLNFLLRNLSDLYAARNMRREMVDLYDWIKDASFLPEGVDKAPVVKTAIKVAMKIARCDLSEGRYEDVCSRLETLMPAMAEQSIKRIRKIRLLYIEAARKLGYTEEHEAVERRMDEMYHHRIKTMLRTGLMLGTDFVVRLISM